jgi:hypothetical protein
MKGTKQLLRALQRARMKHARTKAKELCEAQFPKPKLVAVDGQSAFLPHAKEGQAAILIGAESDERALGRRAS